jgi:hypothetical protein
MPPGMPQFMVRSSATKKGTNSLRPSICAMSRTKGGVMPRLGRRGRQTGHPESHVTDTETGDAKAHPLGANDERELLF